MEFHFHANLSRPRWTRNWSLRRKVIVFLALALLLPPAAFVAASDVFSDVPDNSPFHNDINAIYGARITNGTSPGIFSPNLLVTREQMAVFLHRGLPRVAYDGRSSILTSSSLQDLGVVTIATGGAPGGTGFVKLDASLSAYNPDPTGCPCEVELRILHEDTGLISQRHFLTVNNDIGGVDSNASGSVTWAVTVPTASTQTFRLRARRNNGAGSIVSDGALTGLYVPFGRTGGNTINSPAMAAQAVPEAQELKTKMDKASN